MTVLTAKAADRTVFGILYVAVGLLTLWAGFRMVDYGLEMRFINRYLRGWEIGISAFEAQQGQWPVFSGNNHVAYMESLDRQMRRSGVQPPESNTRTSYRYRIERFGSAGEDVFILCLNDCIMLFGISKKTLDRLDKLVDRRPGLDSGRLIGRPGKNKNTFIGKWRL